MFVYVTGEGRVLVVQCVSVLQIARKKKKDYYFRLRGFGFPIFQEIDKLYNLFELLFFYISNYSILIV